MRFVIVAAPRTGSTHLVTTLARQPDVLCHAEIFAHRVFFHGASNPRNQRLREELTALRSADYGGFIERIFAISEGRSHVGFKIFQGQNDAALRQLIDDASIRKVVLYRKNMLAAYASSVAAKKTGVWGKNAQSDDKSRSKIIFRADRFLRFHDRRVGFYAAQAKRLADTAQPFCWIDYEDLNEPLKIMNLLGFIGAETKLTRVNLGRTRRTPSSVCERFEDPAGVEAFLRQRNLMHWAHEGETSIAPMSAAPVAHGP